MNIEDFVIRSDPKYKVDKTFYNAKGQDTKNTSEAVAIKMMVENNGHQEIYKILVSVKGEVFNPIDKHRVDSRTSEKMPMFKFKSVSPKIFNDYIKFLQSKNKSNSAYNSINREVLSL